MVNNMLTKQQIKDLEDLYDDIKDNMTENCKKMDNELKEVCEATAKALIGYYFSDGSDLDKKLSKIPKKTDYLYFIETSNVTNTANFNKLKSRMSVFLMSFNFMGEKSTQGIFNTTMKMIFTHMKKMKEISFDGSQKSILALGDFLKQKKNRASESANLLNIVGNIKDKVPFITIVFDVKIVNSPLNCETVYMLASAVDNTSSQIQSKFLITDPLSHSFFLKNKNLVNVHQYTFYLVNTIAKYHKISYTANGIKIYESGSEKFSTSDIRSEIPYSFGESVAAIIFTIYIDIYVDDVKLDTYPDVNVTMTSMKLKSNSQSLLEYNSAKIVTNGDWDSVNNKPTVTVTTDPGFKLEMDGTKLQIKQETRYSYKPKKTGLSAGAIAGIVIGCVAFVAIIVVVVVIVVKKKKVSNNNSKS